MEAGRPRQNESPPTVPLHDAEFIAPMELCRPSQELFMISHDPQEQDRFPHNRQPMAVSYTHLDVYKRQSQRRAPI